mmetsp:Transcript_74519/g.210509  ORF Transcript_74519/g.210509 Transcript_74519/m.210509 type:complete len:259 (-) Transcript_74519:442-1218(-)
MLGHLERELVRLARPNHLLRTEPVPGAMDEVPVLVLLAHNRHQVQRVVAHHLPGKLFEVLPFESDHVVGPRRLVVGDAVDEPILAPPACARPHDPRRRVRPGNGRVQGAALVAHHKPELLRAGVAENDAAYVDAVFDLVHLRRLRPAVPAADDGDPRARVPLGEIPHGRPAPVGAPVADAADLVVPALLAEERAAVPPRDGVRRDGGAAPPAHGPQALRTGHRDEVKLLGPDGALARRPDLRPGVEVAARVRAPEAEG